MLQMLSGAEECSMSYDLIALTHLSNVSLSVAERLGRRDRWGKRDIESLPLSTAPSSLPESLGRSCCRISEQSYALRIIIELFTRWCLNTVTIRSFSAYAEPLTPRMGKWSE